MSPRIKSWTWVSNSLGLRLTVLLGGLLAGYGAITAYRTAHTLSKDLLDETRTGTLRLVDTVKRSTRFDMLNTRWEDVHQTIENVGGQEGIEHVRIYNKEGTIMYSSAKEEVSTVVDLNAEACYQCHSAEQPLTHLEQPQRSRIFRSQDGHRVLAAIEVIDNEPGCWTAACHVHPESQSVLGVLDIGVSLGETDRRVAAARARAFGFGLGSTVLVCVLVGFFVNRFLQRPVKNLLSGIASISKGNLDSSIPVQSSDELGRLAESFNAMTRDLAQARAELKSWADVLEQQVEEKTGDLEAAQAQLLRSEKLSSLGILAAGVAHELNSPLTGILTFSHLLLQQAEEGTQMRKDLQLIVNETNRCAAIIRQLLDFSRDNAPEMRPYDLNDVIPRAVTLVEHQALFQNVTIDCRLQSDLAPIELDPGQVEQVIINLLVNAAEAMPKGGTIRISTKADEQAPGSVVVELADTGTGIPAEIIDKIFDPFFSSKAEGSGTGLGLAVSHGIIKRHGGTIEVQSTDGGTTFRITLPMAASEVVFS